MAIGQRIKFFRNRKGMTQKQLGEQLGFMGKTSDVRMAQYESEARVPKIDLVKQMSQIFDINTHALTVPDIDTHIGLMHTLFALEDMYEYSRAMKSHFRKFGNQMSGSGNHLCNYASLLA